MRKLILIIIFASIVLIKINCELKFLPEENTSLEINDPIKKEEKTMSFNDVAVKILGHSGKIEITRDASVAPAPVTDKEVITVTISSLKEKDVDGNEVGKTGSVKHSYENFANLDFKFGEFEDTKLNEVKCRKLKFGLEAGTLFPSLDTTLNINVYLFSESGTIKTGNNSSSEVRKGTMKFSVDVNSWPFCLPKDKCKDSTCCLKGQTNEVGEYLDLEIEIKGSKAAKDKTDNKVMLGDNSQIVLPTEINVDGAWTTMPTGYPQQVGSEKSTYTFRFQKFEKTLSYDPLIETHVGFSQSIFTKIFYELILLLVLTLIY